MVMEKKLDRLKKWKNVGSKDVGGEMWEWKTLPSPVCFAGGAHAIIA